MLTLNQTIQHQVTLERYKAGIGKQLSSDMEKLAIEINSILANIDDTKTSIKKALVEVNKLIDATYTLLESSLLEELKEWLEAEIAFTSKHEKIDITKEESNSLVASILLASIRGNTLNKRLNIIKNNLKNTIKTRVLNGYNDKISLVQILRSVKGTASKKFKDGIWNKIISYLKTTVNTTIQTFSNLAKIKLWEKEESAKYVWLSVLDNRTTAICRARSNKIYVVGKGPIPPAHENCRSSIKRYIEGETIPQSYSEWLIGQPVEVIEDILGVGKAKLFLKGEVALDKFVTPYGRELTLSELKARLN